MDSKHNFLKPDEFVSQFDENKKLAKYIAIYYSGVDASGTKYWCSDTIEAVPYVNNVVLPKLEEIKVKYDFVDCLDKTTFKDPNFVLRTSHKLEKVPTIIYYQEGVEKSRLVEMDCYDEDSIKEFLAAI